MTRQTAPALSEITVGPRDADVIGETGRAIQIAVDALALRGGGTVRVLPGEYELSDSIHMRSNVHLIGDRENTRLKRAPLVRSELALDADIGQKEITPADAGAFRVGMGVMMTGAVSASPGPAPPLHITRIADGRLYLNDYITTNYNAGKGGFVFTYFAMIRGFRLERAVVDGFTVDAAADDITGLEGVRIGGVWLTLCKHCTLRNLTVRNALGDGLLSEPGEHVAVENCESSHNTHHGIHFGSHSPWSRATGCNLHHNGSDGLYLCWGVREGVMADNEIHHNGSVLHRNGISIGHKDTDNVIEHNRIFENAKHGVCFRQKTEANGAHRNILRENVIENNGTPADKVPERFHKYPRRELKYAGIFVNGVTHDLLFERNTIRETRSGGERLQVNAVYLGAGVSRMKMVDNRMEGHPEEAVVDESGSGDHEFQEQSAGQ